MTYRHELDGLRAIAIAIVVLFHAQFFFGGRDYFQGGFIGVNLFFVLSGYLITRMILNEYTKTGQFDYGQFMRRRLRRLVPALWVVTGVSFLIAIFVLDMAAFEEFRLSVPATLSFTANFFFDFIDTPFKTIDAWIKPLHHTWSLGIEMQFYVFFPFIILMLWRVLDGQLWIGLILIIAMCFAYASFQETRNPQHMFYMPMSRHGEFLFGAIVAFMEFRHGSLNKKLSLRWRNPLLVFAISMIVLSTVFFDREIKNAAMLTLIPLFSTTFIIAFASSEDWVGRILASPPLRFLGLMSYSLYLWHYPIFAFGRAIVEEPDNWDKLFWLFLSFFASMLTFALIEDTMRIQSLRESTMQKLRNTKAKKRLDPV